METSLIALAIFFIFAGASHFMVPKFFKSLMPPIVPYHMPIVYGSGVVEIILGGMLFFENMQSLAAILLIVLLIVVFPANIYNTVDFYKRKHVIFPLTVIRLPLQGVLIWWAWLFV